MKTLELKNKIEALKEYTKKKILTAELENKEFESSKMWNLYALLIYREIEKY